VQFIWIANSFGPSDKFVKYSTKLTCLEITGDKYSAVASRTSNGACLKGLEAGIYCK
jgi:hypothetical protein